MKKEYATIQDIKRIMLKPWKIIGSSIVTIILIIGYYLLTFKIIDDIGYMNFANWVFIWCVMFLGGIIIVLILCSMWGGNWKEFFSEDEKF